MSHRHLLALARDAYTIRRSLRCRDMLLCRSGDEFAFAGLDLNENAVHTVIATTESDVQAEN